MHPPVHQAAVCEWNVVHNELEDLIRQVQGSRDAKLMMKHNGRISKLRNYFCADREHSSTKFDGKHRSISLWSCNQS
jgi:hypothetical protein